MSKVIQISTGTIATIVLGGMGSRDGAIAETEEYIGRPAKAPMGLSTHTQWHIDAQRLT